jgi:hypothetical protein
MRICVFCGNLIIGSSKEHIFPQWLIKHLSLKKIKLFHSSYNIDGSLSYFHGLVLNTLKSGFICKDCNNGWLSTLESKTMSLLSPLIDGTFSGKVVTSDCSLISLWAYKTAIILSSVSKQKNIVPAQHYFEFYTNKTIPAGVYIAMAAIKVMGSEDYYWILNGDWSGNSKKVPQEKIIEYLKNSYKITIRAGHVAWRIIYMPRKEIPPLSLFEYRDDAIRWIFPINRDISWPPIVKLKNLFEVDSSLVYLDNWRSDYYK